MYKSRTKEVVDKDNLVIIHKVCHQKIHATFPEKELYDFYHTVERLTEHEQMKKFIKWVSKKPLDYYDKNDQTQHRKKMRRR